MNILDSISNNVKYSNEGYIILTKTVIITLNAIKRAGRASASVQDVTYVINRNYTHSKYTADITEKQVAVIMKKIAKDIAADYKYHGLNVNLVNLDGYFFSL